MVSNVLVIQIRVYAKYPTPKPGTEILFPITAIQISR